MNRNKDSVLAGGMGLPKKTPKFSGRADTFCHFSLWLKTQLSRKRANSMKKSELLLTPLAGANSVDLANSPAPLPLLLIHLLLNLFKRLKIPPECGQWHHHHHHPQTSSLPVPGLCPVKAGTRSLRVSAEADFISGFGREIRVG